MCWEATKTKRAVAWVGSVQPECTVPLSTWILRNFKPEFLLNGKRPSLCSLRCHSRTIENLIQPSHLDGLRRRLWSERKYLKLEKNSDLSETKTPHWKTKTYPGASTSDCLWNFDWWAMTLKITRENSKRQRAYSSWQFLRLGNEQLKTVQNNYYGWK